ncbi:hypothetical protein [Streptodolium elevatio]
MQPRADGVIQLGGLVRPVLAVRVVTHDHDGSLAKLRRTDLLLAYAERTAEDEGPAGAATA